MTKNTRRRESDSDDKDWKDADDSFLLWEQSAPSYPAWHSQCPITHSPFPDHDHDDHDDDHDDYHNDDDDDDDEDDDYYNDNDDQDDDHEAHHATNIQSLLQQISHNFASGLDLI